MKSGLTGTLAAMVLAAASNVFAAPTPVAIELTSLRAIQKYTLDEKADDQVFALVSGVAAGKEFTLRIPDSGKTLTSNPKKPAVSEKEPVTLWKGELNDNEFAVATVTVFQGEDKDDAAVKAFEEKIVAAEKQTPQFARKTLTADDFQSLAGDVVKKKVIPSALVKSEQAVVAKVKETFSRDKKTAHYSGLFNVLVWNDGTTIHKRLAPIGLTFGEHYGNDVKIYTKLKFTRDNVFIQDEKGEWSNVQMAPLSDDEKTVHVKMLETEMVPGSDGNPLRKTTDYLADVQVLANDAAAKWKLEGEVIGVDDIHTYWEYAD